MYLCEHAENCYAQNCCAQNCCALVSGKTNAPFLTNGGAACFCKACKQGTQGCFSYNELRKYSAFLDRNAVHSAHLPKFPGFHLMVSQLHLILMHWTHTRDAAFLRWRLLQGFHLHFRSFMWTCELPPATHQGRWVLLGDDFDVWCFLMHHLPNWSWWTFSWWIALDHGLLMNSMKLVIPLHFISWK